MNLYQDLFQSTVEEEDLADILTNMLACAANTTDSQQVQQVEQLLQRGAKVEKTYEFFFNLAQLQMKQQLQEEAFRSLVHSFNIAKGEEEATMHAELGRFKVQELHMLNSFSHEFSAIEYNLGGLTTGAKFNLSKTLKHDNLVELNMSALA